MTLADTLKLPTTIAVLLLAGCGDATLLVEDPSSDPDTLVAELSSELNWKEAQSLLRGARLFTQETFKGNGRTCDSCHSLATGTLTAQQIRRRFENNPRDPLFRAIDSDHGDGASYSLLLRDATVNVTIQLPDNIYIAEDPTARSVTLRRGIPTTQDVGALDPFLMFDFRDETLQEQAAGAIAGHAEARRAPTRQELNDIAFFEKKALFSSRATLALANGGPELPLPKGTTASEKRGRAFFEGEFTFCGGCHFGSLLNGETGVADITVRGTTIGISEFNYLNNPVLTYVFKLPDGTEEAYESPDPGAALTFGDPGMMNVFKATSLRNIKNTAPYMHDNSSQTLEDVVEHYDLFFNVVGAGDLSDQDKTDLVNYMKLL